MTIKSNIKIMNKKNEKNSRKMMYGGRKKKQKLPPYHKKNIECLKNLLVPMIKAAETGNFQIFQSAAHKATLATTPGGSCLKHLKDTEFDKVPKEYTKTPKMKKKQYTKTPKMKKKQYEYDEY